jgi:hypothetical protein
VLGTFYEQLSDFTDNDIKLAIKDEKKLQYRRITPYSEVVSITTSSSNTDSSEVVESYSVGDPIIAAKIQDDVSVSILHNRLNIPKAVFSELCENAATARFRENIDKSSCLRDISNLMTSCESDLNVALWTTELMIGSHPSTLLDVSEYLNITIRSVVKITDNGEEHLDSLPETTYVPSICFNSLKSISLYVFYANGTIESVEVDVTIQDVKNTTSNQLYEMSYQLTYLNISQSIDSLNDGTIRKNYGNPGYILNSNILAGVTAVFENTTDSKNQIITKYAVAQLRDGLSVYSGLDCENRQRTYIQFDKNLVTACRWQVALSDLQFNCQNNLNVILDELESESSVIGKFGNSDYLNINHWYSIIQADKPTPVCIFHLS